MCRMHRPFIDGSQSAIMTRNSYSGNSLVIGRFQPLHNGHMEVLMKCASESERLIVGIGSAQYSHHPSNPFTAGERYLMIDESLREAGIDNYSIVPIEDLNRYSVWVAHVESMCPPFGRVYTNNPMTRRLFEEAGYEVSNSPMYDRCRYSGTEIRRRILEGEEWRHLVPEATARVIDQIDGVGRIAAIFKGDSGAPLRGHRASGHPGFPGADPRMRRILHRRDDRSRDNRDAGRVIDFHGQRRHLQQRRQGVHSRGVPPDAAGSRRGERRDRRGDGPRCDARLRIGHRDRGHRHSRPRRGHGGEAGRAGVHRRRRRAEGRRLQERLRRGPRPCPRIHREGGVQAPSRADRGQAATDSYRRPASRRI